MLLLLVECDESSAADGAHSALLVPRRTGTGPTCRSVDIGVNIHLLCTTGPWCRTVVLHSVWSKHLETSADHHPHQTPCRPQS